MQYRVQTTTIDKHGTVDVPRSGWVESDSLYEAATTFMLGELGSDREYLDPITVVERDTYYMGHYLHKTIEVACDYELGLRVLPPTP